MEETKSRSVLNDQRSSNGSKSNDDLDRLRKEYSERRNNLNFEKLYSPFYFPQLFSLQHKQKATISALTGANIHSLINRKILEVGCGNGGVLLEFLTYGSSQKQLFGIDLLHNRLIDAHNKLPSTQINCADAQDLPYPSSIFDLVLQYTAFSSVLDEEIKHNMASEMLRVMKPDGVILWYDFWLNPANKQTKGIKPTEIKELFPGCIFHFKKITLAPPIARKIVRYSWVIAEILESLRFLNSHYLVVIQKK